MEGIPIVQIVTSKETGSVVFDHMILTDSKNDAITVKDEIGKMECDIDIDAIAAMRF